MYICDKCGKQVDELAMYTQYENLDGQRVPTMEYEIDDCHCGGTYQEAKKCPICGEYYYNDEVYECCEKCFEENLTLENCLATGDTLNELNFFLTDIFSYREIEEILINEFKKLNPYLQKQYMRKFAEENSTESQDYFINTVVERKKYADIHKWKNNG